jgi:hypothetical protein
MFDEDATLRLAEVIRTVPDLLVREYEFALRWSQTSTKMQ